MISKLSLPWLLMGITLAVVPLTFQNCSPGFVNELESKAPASFDGPQGDDLLSVLSFSSKFATDDPSLQQGAIDTSCLTTTTHEACIFWKNASATKMLEDGSYMVEKPEEDVYPIAGLQTYQNFGINLSSRMTAGKLENAHISVFQRTGTTGTKNFYTGNLRVSLADSTAAATAQRYGVEQIQTFFLLDTFREFMATHAGGFYASAKAIPVNAMNSDVDSNAFFDPEGGAADGSIEIGVRPGLSSRKYPLALSGDVVTHEFNHANLNAANPALAESDDFDALLIYTCKAANPYYVSTLADLLTVSEATWIGKMEAACGGAFDPAKLDIMQYCGTGAGCLGAIDEGQADFFTMTYFMRAPSIGELALPPDFLRYWRKRKNITPSTVEAVMGVPYYDDYKARNRSAPGEIHDMGEIFSELMFEVYADDQTDRDAFLKTSSQILATLSARSTFSTVKDQLIAVDTAAFSSKNKAIIKKVFEGRGF